MDSILDYGAIPDGETLNTEAVQRALDIACERGGGTVYVPPGLFRIGTIELRSHVSLHLEGGATLLGSERREDYREGCLIYAQGAVNATLCGRGAIDGSGPAFWTPRPGGGWDLGPWRPGNLVRLEGCTDLRLEDVTFRRSPGWTIHPRDCVGLYIRGISIRNGVHLEGGPNTDGIDPDGCSNVRISDCDLQCGDDTIVLKITKESKTRRCENVVVTNCILQTRESALKIGSETYGDFRNITFSNCTVADASGGISLQMRDGGTLDGWIVSNIAMTLKPGYSGTPIYLWSHRRTDDTPFGTVRNVVISDLVATGGGTVFISGPAEKPIEDVTLRNLRLLMHGAPQHWNGTRYHDDPPDPFTVFGMKVTPHNMFCRHVAGLQLHNVSLKWGTPEDPKWGAALRCWDVTDLELDGLRARQAEGSAAAAVEFREVRRAHLHDCLAPAGTGTFLRVGEGCEDIALLGNDLSRAERVTEGATEGVTLIGNREPRGPT